MLDQKKIDTAIKRVNKDHRANFVGPEPDSTRASIANTDALDYLANREIDGVAGYIDALFSLENCRPQSRYIVSCQQQGDVAGMQLYLGFWATCTMMWQHLARATLEKTDFVNVYASFYDLGRAGLALLGTGQFDHATAFGKTISVHYTHLISGSGAEPGPFEKDNISPFLFIPGDWHSESSTFEPECYLEQHGYELYAQLFNIWDRPDPEEVRNTFQALRERRVSLACMTDAQQASVLESAPNYWLFYDPLLHAVNMRRLALGLEPVAYKSYIRGVGLPLEKVPFVRDNILYPAYIKACVELDEAPIDFGVMIEVSQDSKNGMLTR
ncbi:hypothetical protein OAC51_10035 [Flavobacteriaceae bacterium]|nr:hypothetical protein [Flavobacteriaceae bacterium]